MRQIQIYHGPHAGTYEINECHDDCIEVCRRASYPRQDWLVVPSDLAVALRVEDLAGRLLREDILCCDSSLVSVLLQSAGDMFSWDDVENLYSDSAEWTAEQCIEWCGDHGEDLPEEDLDEDKDYRLEALRETVRDNAEPAEVYEWWRVTKWLMEELRAIGEPVLDNEYGEWWGRTCTGQGIMLDGTLQAVAARIIAE